MALACIINWKKSEQYSRVALKQTVTWAAKSRVESPTVRDLFCLNYWSRDFKVETTPSTLPDDERRFSRNVAKRK